MKREKLNTLSERDLLIGLITSDRFCREIAPILNPRLLEIDYSRIVSSWVKEYYEQFLKAPKQNISKLYRIHCEELKDEALQENILSFIEKISNDYINISNINEDFAIEQAINYLKGRSLKNLSVDIDSYLSLGDVKNAENVITKFRKIERSSGENTSILNNFEAIANTYTNEDSILFQFPNAFGKVVGSLHREDFLAYLAPMKRGKSWLLIHTAVTAMMNGLKVVFFSLEMSKESMIKRVWTVLSGQLQEAKDDINFPYFELENDGLYRIRYKEVSRKAVDITSIETKQKALRRLARGGDIQIVSVPAYSLTVESLDAHLDDFEQDEYVPDVIIVDYADIMSPSEKGDYRHQIDGIWKRLRGLAQKRKALVVTASQSNRESLNRDVDASDISEDIRKIAHVTSMVSLNQTQADVTHNVIRLKQIALREGEREFRQAVCLQCLNIGIPILDSRFDDEVKLDYEEPKREEQSRHRK